MLQKVFKYWLVTSPEKANHYMDDLIAKGYFIRQFQVVHDIKEDYFYLIVLAEVPQEAVHEQQATQSRNGGDD